jgi:hypothetical protein
MAMSEDIFWCCKSNLPIFAPSDGYAKDGEQWICPTCGEQYVHVCDEAEGCCWEHAIPV